MLKKLTFLFALIAAVVGFDYHLLDIDVDNYWDHFKRIHAKEYNETEESNRRTVFAMNLKRILSHNIEADLGWHTYTMGVNRFADMTSEEFSMLYNNFRDEKTNQTNALHTMSNDKLPESVDWRTKGLVTPVRSQGGCGSCWAFSAVASIEGQHAKVSGNLVILSEQQLVDCSSSFGNKGCRGGLMDNAFRYVIANKGIDTGISYPYLATNGSCRYNNKTIGATITGYKDVAKGNEIALQDAVANIGPVSVAINASKAGFQFYKSGVYDDPTCSQSLNHGVTVVGYGTDVNSKKDYWIVKNSWGSGWGEGGYVKMVRNKGDQCGIALLASYPIV